MSKKKAIARKQRRINERARLEAEKATESRVNEVTEDDGPERDEQPKRADIESLRQLPRMIAECEKGYRAQLMRILAEIYRQAWDLRTGSMKVWSTFLKEDFWTGKKLSSPKKERIKAFTRLCEYGFNTETVADRKRTCKFGQTLSYYNEIGVEPRDLIAKIKKAGGLEKAYKLSVEHRKVKLSKKSGAVSTKGEVFKSSENSGNMESGGSFQKEDQEPYNNMTFKVEKGSKDSVLSERFDINNKLRNRLHDMQKGEEVTLVCNFLGEDNQNQARYKVCRVRRTKNN